MAQHEFHKSEFFSKSSDDCHYATTPPQRLVPHLVLLGHGRDAFHSVPNSFVETRVNKTEPPSAHNQTPLSPRIKQLHILRTITEKPNHPLTLQGFKSNPLQPLLNPPRMIRHMNDRGQSMLTRLFQKLHIQPLQRNQWEWQMIEPFRIPLTACRRINALKTKLRPPTLPRPHRIDELVPFRIVGQPAQSPSRNNTLQPPALVGRLRALRSRNIPFRSGIHPIPLSLRRSSAILQATRRSPGIHIPLPHPTPEFPTHLPTRHASPPRKRTRLLPPLFLRIFSTSATFSDPNAPHKICASPPSGSESPIPHRSNPASNRIDQPTSHSRTTDTKRCHHRDSEPPAPDISARARFPSPLD